MTARPRTSTATRAAFAAAAACTVLLAACAAPTTQATPAPPSSVTASSPAPAPSGSPVTAPALSTPAKSSTAAPKTSAKPSTSAAPLTSAVTSAPPPPPVPAEPPQVAPPAPTDTPDPVTREAPTTAAPPPPTPATRDPAPARGASGGGGGGGGGGGKTVVIDPGHNGGNAGAPDVINALVPAGFGQTKPCNTTGTETNDGFPEHDFTWAVANDLRSKLEAQGITVVMTRSSDDGVGPCVNKRAAIGNDAGADVVVSIHGDGDQASAQGFYVMTAEQDPAGAAMAAESHGLAVDVRDGLVSAGLSPSNHLGSDGLWPRNDLAGLNLSLRPTVMIEAGNMRNSADAALMKSDSGQQQVAQGLANGVLSYLGAG